MLCLYSDEYYGHSKGETSFGPNSWHGECYNTSHPIRSAQVNGLIGYEEPWQAYWVVVYKGKNCTGMSYQLKPGDNLHSKSAAWSLALKHK